MGTELLFIDEFETVLDAPPVHIFDSVSRRIGRTFEGPLGGAFTALLGCAYRGSDYTTPPTVDQQVNGFRVAAVEAPHRLVLEGRHRFAAYRLTFAIDEAGDGRSRLRARTDADFPGLKGALYRALVIGSGAHRVVVKRMLSAAANRVERRDKGTKAS